MYILISTPPIMGRQGVQRTANRGRQFDFVILTAPEGETRLPPAYCHFQDDERAQKCRLTARGERSSITDGTEVGVEAGGSSP
jgi:hypothetical protein